MRKLTSLLAGLIVAVCLAPGIAQAQDNNLTRGYVLTAKPGLEAQLIEALRAHAQWRKANHDPWVWSIYTPETGELGTIHIRSSNHTWADFAAYEEGFNTLSGPRYNADVGPLVESVTSTIDISLPDTLNQRPAAGTTTFLVNVTTFLLRPGMEQQAMQAIGQAVRILKAAHWPAQWAWFRHMSGGDDLGPTIMLAGFNGSWGDMAEPDPSFDAVMVKALGVDGFTKWVASFNATLRGTRSVLYRYRPDLSVTP